MAISKLAGKIIHLQLDGKISYNAWSSSYLLFWNLHNIGGSIHASQIPWPPGDLNTFDKYIHEEDASQSNWPTQPDPYLTSVIILTWTLLPVTSAAPLWFFSALHCAKLTLFPSTSNSRVYTLTSSGYGSAQVSRSVVSDSLRPRELQHARSSWPSPTPGVYSNSCPSSRWCHPAISSSVVPSSSCPQSLQASGSFPMSQLFAWGGQSIGVSASTSVLPMNTQNWSPLGWTGWISMQSKGLSKESSPTPQFNSINSLALSFLWRPTLTSIHDHWKNHSLD